MNSIKYVFITFAIKKNTKTSRSSDSMRSQEYYFLSPLRLNQNFLNKFRDRTLRNF